MRSSIIQISLLVGVWTATAQSECPSGCNCSDTSLYCTDQQLESVPDLRALNYSPMVLDFSGNLLLSITSQNFDFAHNDKILEVYLNSSSLTEIAEGTFTSLEGLQELYLGQNALSTLPDDLIQGLDDMVMLDMSNNYFNGDLPTIRSKSLEMLACIDSKVLSIPPESLNFLPNLRLLLLQENSIQTLSLAPFQSFEPNALSVNLLFNAWKCSCDNLETFHQLSEQKFIDPSEPYQCTDREDEVVNVFEAGIQLEELCVGMSMTTEGNRSESLVVDGAQDAEPGGCWELFVNVYSHEGYLKVILITTAVSFLLGFFFGVVSCKLIYSLRYKKLEQSSDSQVQLL